MRTPDDQGALIPTALEASLRIAFMERKCAQASYRLPNWTHSRTDLYDQVIR